MDMIIPCVIMNDVDLHQVVVKKLTLLTKKMDIDFYNEVSILV